MNCKAGDLAVIVRSRYDKKALGTIVRVTAFVAGLSAWEFEGGKSLRSAGYWCISDDCLMPLRNTPDVTEAIAYESVAA